MLQFKKRHILEEKRKEKINRNEFLFFHLIFLSQFDYLKKRHILEETRREKINKKNVFSNFDCDLQSSYSIELLYSADSMIST
jgi:hypothetical protein